MNEIVLQNRLQQIRTISYGRSLGLLALMGMNWLLLTATLVSVTTWLEEWGSIWLVLGVMFSQIYLLSFWSAFRGGSLVIRLGWPFLAVVVGGFLAIETLTQFLTRWPPDFAVLPVPLGISFLVGLGLLLPLRWLSGKTLLFSSEEPPAGRPWQLRIHQIVGWTLLLAVTLGLARAAAVGALAQTDMVVIVVFVPGLLGYLSLLSIPFVRGVFAPSHSVFWSVLSLLLVTGIGLLIGTAGCALLWQS